MNIRFKKFVITTVIVMVLMFCKSRTTANKPKTYICSDFKDGE